MKGLKKRPDSYIQWPLCVPSNVTVDFMRKIKQASKQKLNRLYEKYKIWLHAMSKSELTGTEIALAHIKNVELKNALDCFTKR